MRAETERERWGRGCPNRETKAERARGERERDGQRGREGEREKKRGGRQRFFYSRPLAAMVNNHR